MADPKGFRLYVNLSAAEVRRRLKGHGFGVRKIASAGKGQAVIVHTATGRHLQDLEALFQGLIEQPPAAERPSAREGDDADSNPESEI
jgi:hypothetical protein